MPLASSPAHADPVTRLEEENSKLRKINRVLMDRVERDMDAQGGNAYSLFQTAITLEGRISERTAQLTDLTHRLMHEISERRQAEAALQEAKAEAEQANLGKTRFLAAASHDLHQPLSAARLFLGTLADEVQDERARSLVRRVEAALETVDALLNELLDMSRLDAGAWPVSKTTFAIAPLLGRLAEEYGAQARACGLDLRLAASSAVVHTDRQLLERIVRNFLSNAIRYTDGGRVLIGCHNRGASVSIEVWDTGIGIPPDQRTRIFEEFRQLGGGPRREDKGLGLGLAIVDRIARLLSLPLEVDSRIGHGSRFAVLVPRADPNVVPIEADPASALRSPGGMEGRLVVCIDDDVQILDAMAELLGAWQCDVIAAATVEEAGVALAQTDRVPDILIADYHLQGGALGTDAIAALHAHYGCSIPAVVVSSNRTAAMRAVLKARGLNYLAKPIPPARLRAMMSYLIGNRDAPST